MILDDMIKKMMKIIGKIEFTLLDIGVSYPYTYSIIKGGKGIALGLCMSLVNEISSYEHRTAINLEKGKLSIEDIVKEAADHHLIKRFLGISMINAISQYMLKVSRDDYGIDVTNIILKKYPESKEYNVAVIGYIKPVVNKLREKGYRVYIFERDPVIRKDAFPDFFEYRYLPDMDIVIVTGAALINDTLDLIIERSRNAREIILTGPTAQVYPKFIEGNGISYLSSINTFFKEENFKTVKNNLVVGNEKILWKKTLKYSIKIRK